MSRAPGARGREETARVEAFSDGVFAIAITLLILEIRVPHAAGAGLGRALLAEWPSFVAFLTSFATIGIMWLNHHRLFGLVGRVDHTLLVLNGLLLLGVTFVPFPTAVVAEYLGQSGDLAAAQFYSATFVVIAIAFNALWRYAASERRTPTLLRLSPQDPAVRAIHAQYAVGPLLYVAALVLAFWDARASVALNMLLAVYFAIPPRRAGGPGPGAVGALAVVLALPLAAPAAAAQAPGAGAPGGWPPGTQIVSFEERDGLILAPATLRSASGRERSGLLLFDTGAPGLTLREEVARALRIDTLEVDWSRVTLTRRPLAAVEIGATRLTGVGLNRALADTLLDSDVLGLFGPSLLGDRGFAVDYERRELVILERRLTLVGRDASAAATDAPAARVMRARRSRARFGELLPAAAVAVPLRVFPGGRILVNARVEDTQRGWASRPLSLLLDTGASACALFRDAVAERLTRAPAWPRLAGVRVRTVLGEAREDVMLLPSLVLTDAVPPLAVARVEAGATDRRSLPDIQGELPEPVHGLLGYSFLRRFRVLLDHENELVWLVPRAGAEPPRSGRASVGLELEERWGQLRVAAVAPGSPAAGGGVQFGETLISIDRAPVAGMAAEKAERLLEGPPGSEVVVVIRREGMERVLRLARR